ncbi:MAG: redoxin domain-containing protein [Deltaproteobacteria bacterium]|jgi:peroxiredoxin|nr:redoxin domain-containing protein [Deltaproteobacteria bacterium]
MLRAVQIRIFAIALLGALIACGDATSGDAAAPGNDGDAVASAADPAKKAAKPGSEAKRKQPPRRERPLPNFSGRTLQGEQLSISSMLGKRLVVFFFNPEVKAATPAAKAIDEIAKLRGKYNFDILGVATGSTREKVVAFVAENRIDFSVLDDSSASIARRMGLRQPMAVIGVDAEGFIIFGIQQLMSHAPDPERAIESQIREALRLPSLASESEPILGNRPLAPLFSADILDAEQRFDLAAHRGRAIVLIFFLHTCPHCHHTLAFLREALDELPDDKRPTLIGVEISGRTAAVRRALKEQKLDFFPVAFDDDGAIQDSYGVFGGVPDTFYIDARGRIAARVKGWDPKRDAHIARMRMARLAGAPVPMLLRKSGYSGNEACGICHELEEETWLFTKHASAYDTLVKHGDANDEECVGCHVVGYSEPGGFTSARQTPELENVGCESCHGRGGPHVSPEFAPDGDYEDACAACHTPEHSLGFDYDTFLTRISHAENAHVTKLSLEERRALLEEIGAPRDVLPTSAAHVGSDSCRSCHESEYATWAASPHAAAVATLEKEGKSDRAECLACHTTAYGQPGGFPKDGAVKSHADLARVGCESCHGPGGEHVKKDTVKIGNIVALGDKCDSCVILQICGRCHDEANDPGFEFEVVEKIDAQRHGTIEAGSGKPKARGAALSAGTDVALSVPQTERSVDRRRGEAATWTPR